MFKQLLAAVSRDTNPRGEGNRHNLCGYGKGGRRSLNDLGTIGAAQTRRKLSGRDPRSCELDDFPRSI